MADTCDKLKYRSIVFNQSELFLMSWFVFRGKALGLIAVHFSLFFKSNVSQSGANYAVMSKSELSSFYNF